ncbi:MAG: NADH-quinone oxidoreductase subunit K [Chloroflexota bacterium]
MTPWPDLIALFTALALLAIGLACLLTRKRVVQQVIGLNIMVNAAALLLIDAGRQHDNLSTVQGFVVSVLVVEAIVLSIALAIVANIFRHHPSGSLDDLTMLKG